MASINASTAGVGGVITTADNTGILNLQSGGTTVATISSTGVVVGAGSANNFLNINGASSGTNGGASLNVLNGGTTRIALGNYSNLIGGTYDATATIYANGALRFWNGATNMTLDASGNLGLGASTISPYSNTYKALLIDGGAQASSIQLNNTTTGSGLNTGGLLLVQSGSESYIWNPKNSFMSFGTNNAERMRIDTSGNLLVGTTSVDPITSQVNGISLGSDQILRTCVNGAPAAAFSRRGTDGTLLAFHKNVTAVGSISVTASATAYNTSSDYRLKENIAPMVGALDTVQALKPVTYNWKVDGSDGQGFIAHELAKVVPDCVSGEKDAVDEDGNPVYQGIDTSFLVATLVAAIQELKAEIDLLKGAKVG